MSGTWEGTLGPINGAGLSVLDKPLPIRIVVQDDGVRVFTGDKFDLEAKPGKFKIDRVATNMVIFATDSGKDKEGIWVETWAFVATQKDHDTLNTNFYRVVNNTEMPGNAPDSKFTLAKVGELKRVSR